MSTGYVNSKVIYGYLKNKNIDFISECKFSGCKDKRLLEFDFYIKK